VIIVVREHYRIADTQFRGQDDLLRASFFAADALEEKPRRRCTHLVSGLMDGRKSGVGEHSQLEVVKANDGDVLGAA